MNAIPASDNPVRSAVNEYCKLHNLPLFEISSLFPLTPEHWSENSVPFPRNAGCYLFYAPDGSLLYVGKASMGADLAGRVINYIASRPNFAFKKQWTIKPGFLQTIKVEKPYQAPSLEEYLIENLKPLQNMMGRRRPPSIDA